MVSTIILLSTIIYTQAQYYPYYDEYDKQYQDYSYQDNILAPSESQLSTTNLPLLVIPFLMLLALFLLFPAYVTISSVKRMALSARDTNTFNVDLLERIHRMTTK